MRRIKIIPIIFVMMFSLALPATAWSRGDILPDGGVPVLVNLSVGFGEDNFVVFSGMGAAGIFEFGQSDLWITGGLYTGIAILGDPSNDDTRGDSDPDNTLLPSEGWGINPGASLGFTLGLIPQVDIHLLGYGGPSFALLSEFERNQDGDRIEVDRNDEKVGATYGGLAAITYTGNIPWLRGVSLGFDAAYHNHTFDRWHYGFTIGIAF